MKDHTRTASHDGSQTGNSRFPAGSRIRGLVPRGRCDPGADRCSGRPAPGGRLHPGQGRPPIRLLHRVYARRVRLSFPRRVPAPACFGPRCLVVSQCSCPSVGLRLVFPRQEACLGPAGRRPIALAHRKLGPSLGLWPGVLRFHHPRPGFVARVGAYRGRGSRLDLGVQYRGFARVVAEDARPSHSGKSGCGADDPRLRFGPGCFRRALLPPRARPGSSIRGVPGEEVHPVVGNLAQGDGSEPSSSVPRVVGPYRASEDGSDSVIRRLFRGAGPRPGLSPPCVEPGLPKAGGQGRFRLLFPARPTTASSGQEEHAGQQAAL